jgi:hypothetical protein
MNFNVGHIESFNQLKASGFIVSGDGTKFYFRASHFCRLVNTKVGVNFVPDDLPLGGFENGVKVAFTFSPRKVEKAKLPFTPVDAFCVYSDYKKIFGEKCFTERCAHRLGLVQGPSESKYAFKQRVKKEEYGFSSYRV